MHLREFLAQAAAAAGQPAVATTTGNELALAEPATAGMRRDIARFERGVDLIRQSLDIPGMSIAVVHGQKVILARGFGVVDIAKRTAATEHTPYPIASLTKTFAAAVIMRLIEAGKLDLDEPMSTYDPGYAQWCSALKTQNVAAARNYDCNSARITVRHHLSHNAEWQPGTVYNYNGVLFARLTQVIEAVAAKEFNRLLEEDILDPLGMNDTALGVGDRRKAHVVARMAKRYKLEKDGTLAESASVNPPFLSMNAATGLISTVTDLVKYDVAIDRGAVYSPQAKQQIWTVGTSPTGQRFPYGLGWFVTEHPPGNPAFFWHYGWLSEFSSLLLKVPERRLTLILLACTERASSVFFLGNGDPLRSPFVTAFLDSFKSAS